PVAAEKRASASGREQQGDDARQLHVSPQPAKFHVEFLLSAILSPITLYRRHYTKNADANTITEPADPSKADTYQF
ncbi:MAG: hypothetical protein IJG13_09445, partial [Kiritimatiellae bacterium]|nr:hypothetical protein [Kiritimatiellia bacterium]